VENHTYPDSISHNNLLVVEDSEDPRSPTRKPVLVEAAGDALDV
jgi:hypothetical protein